jgi:hypothetical protein
MGTCRGAGGGGVGGGGTMCVCGGGGVGVGCVDMSRRPRRRRGRASPKREGGHGGEGGGRGCKRQSGGRGSCPRGCSCRHQGLHTDVGGASIANHTGVEHNARPGVGGHGGVVTTQAPGSLHYRHPGPSRHKHTRTDGEKRTGVAPTRPEASPSPEHYTSGALRTLILTPQPQRWRCAPHRPLAGPTC